MSSKKDHSDTRAMDTSTQGSTEIDSGLIDAYRAASYWVGEADAAFCLRVGELSQELARLFRDRGVGSAAYITAFNPYSRQPSPDENEAAHHALLRAMRERRVAVVHAVSKASDGTHAEKGLVALGLARDAAIELGKRFEQNAIVFADTNATPELLLLR